MDDSLCIDDNISEGEAHIDTKGETETKKKDMTRRIKGTIIPDLSPLPKSSKVKSLALESLFHDHENSRLVRSTD